MIGATIDIYHEEISSAVASGDSQRICEIAKCFYERHGGYMPWRILRVGFSRDRADSGGSVFVDATIEFDNGKEAVLSMGYRHGKQVVVLEGETIYRGRMDQCVETLGVPMSFIDGMYFLCECLSRYEEKYAASLSEKVSRTMNLISELERKRKASENALRRAVSMVKLYSKCERVVEVQRIDYKRAEHIACLYKDVPASEFVSLEQVKDRASGVSGIYFAWCVKTGKCVYVGKSKDIGSRVGPGRRELQGCCVTWINLPESEIHTWELFYIWLMKPARNGQVIEGERCAGDACKHDKEDSRG